MKCTRNARGDSPEGDKVNRHQWMEMDLYCRKPTQANCVLSRALNGIDPVPVVGAGRDRVKILSCPVPF